MEIELGPFPKYENIKNHAYWSRVHIDTKLRIDKDGIEDYKMHLSDCEKNSTIGLLAGKKYITGKPMNYPLCADRNIRYLERQPRIDTLKKSIEDKIDKLYPKTKCIRQYIIDNNRVVLDGIEKSRKYTTLNKLMILLKKFV